MQERVDLVAEAQRLVDVYRRIASETPPPQDMADVGYALGRALEALEQPGGTPEAMSRAETELATARQTLARIRRDLTR